MRFASICMPYNAPRGGTVPTVIGAHRNLMKKNDQADFFSITSKEMRQIAARLVTASAAE